MASETSIYRAILRAIKKEYGTDSWMKKMHGNAFTGPGLQDLVGVIRGRSVAIEVKCPGEEPDPIQYHEIAMWKRAGAISGWVDNVKDAMKMIRDEL